MKKQRTDTQSAFVVDAAIRVNTLWGCVSAWHYLRQRGVSKQISLRVLSPRGARRCTDAPHPAVRDALEAMKESGVDHVDMLQRAQSGPDSLPPRRTNDISAAICNRAVYFSETHGSQYAESILRIYGLKVSTIMRVLYEPRARRRQPKP